MGKKPVPECNVACLFNRDNRKRLGHGRHPDGVSVPNTAKTQNNHTTTAEKQPMALPSIGPNPRFLEELRLGGGYGSSPDGGADFDKQGNAAFDGDLTLEGDLDCKGHLDVDGEFRVHGFDETWSRFFLARDGWPAVLSGASGPNLVSFDYFTHSAYVFDFPTAPPQYATFNAILPRDYDGRPIAYNLFWTATDGTSGTVDWMVYAICFGDGTRIDLDNANLSEGIDDFQGLNVLHMMRVVGTPLNASVGPYLQFSVKRATLEPADDFDGTARLIGVRVSFELTSDV